MNAAVGQRCRFSFHVHDPSPPPCWQLLDPSLCAKILPTVAVNADAVTYTALPASSTAGGVVPKPEVGICKQRHRTGCNQTPVVFAFVWF